MTNNQAEYQGILSGLRIALQEQESYREQQGQSLRTELIVQGDSNLIIQQVSGNWVCRHANLKPLYGQAMGLLERFRNDHDNTQGDDNNGQVSMQHVSRLENEAADGTYIC